MGPTTHKLLLIQGYSESALCECRNISLLACWTPMVCASLGLTGLYLKSPIYMLALGLLTKFGAFTSRSFNDCLYSLFIKPVWNFGDMPRHGY